MLEAVSHKLSEGALLWLKCPDHIYILLILLLHVLSPFPLIIPMYIVSFLHGMGESSAALWTGGKSHEIGYAYVKTWPIPFLLVSPFPQGHVWLSWWHRYVCSMMQLLYLPEMYNHVFISYSMHVLTLITVTGSSIITFLLAHFSIANSLSLYLFLLGQELV